MQSDETLLIQFSVAGGVCYLSQQETLTMWRRCLARAGIGVSFSQGFNPHPKISLPLPRSVGIEGDEEIVKVMIRSADAEPIEDLDSRLNRQLPIGCRVLKTERFERKINCRPVSLVYVLSFKHCPEQNEWILHLEQCRRSIESKESFIVYRYGPKHANGLKVDVGPYFQSLRWDHEKIYVRCRFSPEGTVRAEEILARFGMKRNDLIRPMLRTDIEWQMQ